MLRGQVDAGDVVNNEEAGHGDVTGPTSGALDGALSRLLDKGDEDQIEAFAAVLSVRATSSPPHGVSLLLPAAAHVLPTKSAFSNGKRAVVRHSIDRSAGTRISPMQSRCLCALHSALIRHNGR